MNSAAYIFAASITRPRQINHKTLMTISLRTLKRKAVKELTLVIESLLKVEAIKKQKINVRDLCIENKKINAD